MRVAFHLQHSLALRTPAIASTSSARMAVLELNRTADDSVCHALGDEDDTGFVCSDVECVEGEVFLCNHPPEADASDLICVEQTGLSMDGKPVYACTKQPTQPANNDNSASGDCDAQALLDSFFEGGGEITDV